MTQKELRAIAREALGKYLKGEPADSGYVHAAIQVLHAPQHKGE